MRFKPLISPWWRVLLWPVARPISSHPLRVSIKFHQAMNCVMGGGTAWRPKSLYVVQMNGKGNIVECYHDPELERIMHDDGLSLFAPSILDYTAKDWQWKEKTLD